MKLSSFFRSKEISRATEISIVGLVIAAFVGIVSATIGSSSIWFDEAFGAYLIRFNFAEIFHYTSLDVHPPFYYWLLKVWSMLFGTSDVALRSMSVLFGVVGLVFAYLLIRKLFSRRAALWTIVLLAIMPFFVRYAQEARMYTLVAAITLAATYVLTLAVSKKKWKWWIIYGVLVALGMWTHYFTALIWIAHWVWRGIDMYVPKMKIKQFLRHYFSKQWTVAHIVAIGLFSLWLPSLIFQLVVVQSSGFWIPPIDPSTLPSYITTVLYYLTSNETSPWLTVASIGTVILWVIVARRAYSTFGPVHRRWFALLATMASVPVTLLLIGSLPPLQSSFVDRYLLAASISLLMLSGIIIANTPRQKRTVWVRNALIVLLVGGMTIGVTNVYHFGNFNKTTGQKSAARQLVAEVAAASTGNEPIIANEPWLFYDAIQYRSAQHEVYFVDALTRYRYGSLEMLRTNDMFKIKDLPQFTKEHTLIWYIDLAKEKLAVPPTSSWQPLKTISVADPYTGKPAYHAVLYKTH